MHIVIGNDHAGPKLKEVIKEHLQSKGHEVSDLGVKEGEKIDYPIIAKEVALKVRNKEADLGIIICGTGIGVSISANKVKGIRAACVSEPYSAKLAREHNDANILCFGARVVGEELAKMIVDEFIAACFLGDRHQRRVDLIKAIEEE